MDENLDSEIDGDVEGDDEGQLDIQTDQRQAIMKANDTSLFQYHRWKTQGRVNLNPDWQRDYVWTGKRPSMLIESLLLNIPIPVIFLAKTPDECYEVIDGVQRLTTVFNFFENKFKLKELEVFKEFEGKSFSELDKGTQSALEDSVIKCFILSENTPQDLKFLTFERINTGGIKLNEMEVRNCIYRGTLNEKIKELAKNQNFVDSINMKNLSKRMLDRNLVLRFLAFHELNYTNATSGLKSFLNRFFENYQNAKPEVLSGFEKNFKNAMRNAVTVFGTHAYRLRRGDSGGGGEWASRPNATIFQVIATSLARYDTAQVANKADAIFEEYLDILQDQKWIDSVSKSTGDASNIRYSFETWNNRLSVLMSEAAPRDKNRAFSKALKVEIFNQDPTCSLCGNEIKTVNDAALDHIDQYWRGGKTIPSNARLTHRSCNQHRSKFD